MVSLNKKPAITYRACDKFSSILIMLALKERIKVVFTRSYKKIYKSNSISFVFQCPLLSLSSVYCFAKAVPSATL